MRERKNEGRKIDAMYEVVIIGGSVAGLSAALLLARCRRRVLVCDSGRPRNRFSSHMHGFLSREGIPPQEFLRISREQVAAYPSVHFFDGSIKEIEQEDGGFAVCAEDGSEFHARLTLLAIGIVDELPKISGIEAFYGKSVHHCPYCDGWEHRDQPVAVWGQGKAGLELAEEMRIWSSDVVYCSEGTAVSADARQRLKRRGILIEETPVAALEGSKGQLDQIRLVDGRSLRCQALFFASGQKQNCDLARQLGCKLEGDCIDVGEGVETGVPGVYAAGNTATGLQLAIVAASEGTRAAHAINTALVDLDGARPF